MRLLPIFFLIFCCGAFGQKLNNQNNNIIASTEEFNLTDFETQCRRIGFKPNTEKFGECVMDLFKNRTNTKTQGPEPVYRNDVASQDRFVSECAKMGFREGSTDLSNCALSLRKHDAEMNLHNQQQQIYKAQVEQAEKVNRIAATQRLLEIANQGFAMAAGNSPTSAGQRNVKPMSPLPPPSPLQFVSPAGNRYTCAYSGVQLVCR